MLNQTGGSKVDTVFKLVLVFFLSILSFSVGILVGRQFTESQQEQALLDNMEAAEDRATASIPDFSPEVEPNTVISEADIDALSEEFVKKEKKAQEPSGDGSKATAKKEDMKKEKKSPAQARHKEVKKKSALIADEIAQVTRRIAAGEKVAAPAKKKSRMPTSLPKNLADSTIGKYTVQVGSFASETDATKRVENFKAKGFSAFYVPATVKGKTWYRVSIGSFNKRAEAKNYRTKILKEGGVASAIVQKISP